MQVTKTVKHELNWWLSNLTEAYNIIDRGEAQIELQTDATPEAWGAMCDNVRAGGYFSIKEKEMCTNNINAFELKAIQLSLQAFADKLRNKNVLIKSDNITAVAYVVNMGGTKSQLCNKIVNDIWEWCIENKIWVTAEYLPGNLNYFADYESREINPNLEWALTSDIFNGITKVFGKPEIDLFATRLNAKLENYVSWKPDPNALYVNAFTISWSCWYSYCFPPFSLLTQCAQKIRREKAEVLAIVPFWPSQVWFTPIMEMLVEYPLLLPKDKNILYLPQNPQALHPLHAKMRLVTCRLSGDPCRQAEYQKRLSILSHVHGDQELVNSMELTLHNGRAIVIKNRLVPMNHL